MLPNIGYGELLVILAVVLLLFGGSRIPEVARSLGRAVNAFKAGLRESPSEPAEVAAPAKAKE